MFDEYKGSIKTLILLNENLQGIHRLKLLSMLKEVGVGGTAAYKALEALEGHKMITAFNARSHTGRNLRITSITEKGREVAKRLIEIMEILQED